MKLLNSNDFLADIQFIDYWDANSLLNGKAADFLADIQFVDYWDTGFFLTESRKSPTSKQAGYIEATPSARND